MSIEDGFSSLGALNELRMGMSYNSSCCIKCESRIRADERLLIEKAFNKLHGSEYSWWEVVELAEQLKEQKNE